MLLFLALPAAADPPILEDVSGGDDPPAIVGGAPAAAGDWPAAAAIYVSGSFSCSGVLVAPDVVLTAAHCLGNPYVQKHVVLDTIDHTTGTVPIPVEASYGYEDPFNTFDVAAFVLSEPAPVQPRRILQDCMVEDYLRAGATVSIVGYGATDEWGTEDTTRLHEARVSIEDPDCSDLAAGCNEDVSPGGELIAGGDGTDSCTGDSGGPLYLETPDGIFLAGLTSRAALPAPSVCGHGGIYVRTDAIIDWVEQVTGRDLPAPDCELLNRAPDPRADPIQVAPGESGSTTVDPRDPNDADTHTFEILEDPEIGEAEIDDDGRVTFSAPDDLDEDTEILVQVTDEHGASAELTVEVRLSEGDPRVDLSEPGCGCRSGAPSGLALLPLLLLGLRRRT